MYIFTCAWIGLVYVHLGEVSLNACMWYVKRKTRRYTKQRYCSNDSIPTHNAYSRMLFVAFHLYIHTYTCRIQYGFDQQQHQEQIAIFFTALKADKSVLKFDFTKVLYASVHSIINLKSIINAIGNSEAVNINSQVWITWWIEKKKINK